MTWELEFNTLVKEVWKNDPSWPKFLFRKIKGSSERYALSYAGGVLTLEAESLTGAAYGLSLASIAASSGQIAEFLGEHASPFPLRPLWIQGETHSFLENPSLKAEIISKRLLLLGFNAIVLDWNARDAKALRQFIEKLKSSGLKIILRPTQLIEELPPSCHPDFFAALDLILQQLKESIEPRDFLFWEATIYSTKSERERDFLRSDLAKLEIMHLERKLAGKCRLIYYIPTPNPKEAVKEGRFLPKCFLTSSQSTIFAFSANAGGPSENLELPHPLWEVLRTAKQNSHYQLLPLINAGHLGQGEGFWPLLPLKSIERSIPLCRAPQFLGACTLTSHLPKESSLLSCSLWITGHSLIGIGSPRVLASTWIRGMHPDFLEYPECLEIMEECGTMAAMLRGLSNLSKNLPQGHSREEFKLLAESLLAKLKHLQYKLANKSPISGKNLTFYDRFQLFARDAKKLIFFFLQQTQLPVVNVLNEGDMEESFWTDISTTGSIGRPGSLKVSLRDRPNTGRPGTSLAAIYEEVISL